MAGDVRQLLSIGIVSIWRGHVVFPYWNGKSCDRLGESSGFSRWLRAAQAVPGRLVFLRLRRIWA